MALQQASGTQDKDSERKKNLHVRGSTSQPSRGAEGREQTMNIRNCHRERAGKVTLYTEGLGRSKLSSDQPHETILNHRDWNTFLLEKS